ncbi:aminopeptidase N [Pandoraea pulmonicola]|uniref:Aminopeptidase N n=1 Tax=Pandoraea pulmonicola TaxID=93221 RepID=A0AAJ4ZG11_PANPU|nr:aminopeptidase N [Pandoraea pulmonicola]AJC19366.1 aminopeptidase N [Pandoraea pulmonicola]SUA92635.1 Aminopeptidase N [Pandoraea pulmonicola]
MLRTDLAGVIQRSDYTPPAYLIDTVQLDFDLAPDVTTVTSRLRVRRNPAGGGGDLELAGQGLQLVSLELDGKPWAGYRTGEETLSVEAPPEAFELTLVTRCRPQENTSLMGLYVSGGNFFTQCEAEGFRKITYFLDRPDVMATYTVTLRADREAYPVLLANGNLIDKGDLPDGRHFAVWDDPFKKPSYLFALVAGRLVCREERIVAGDGREKLLQVWVQPQDLDKTEHAMHSLVNSIRWDEERFGRVLDLDRFMIVAVSDFNMGAMENKGLNIFNTKYVLADAATATDDDFGNIEAVVGHEYFHNWTGNRVTCRDWFQLSLKEGLTVFRDQEFSADMMGSESGRAVKRIDDVRVLRQAQFPEDAGPMAHPVRPESYVEINNFYTVTVYEKGAEVVRMYQTLLGRDGFRRGMDLYFERHDGQAVTCDDFRAAMADANQRDLTQFGRWYSQAGTPRVTVETAYDEDARTYTLTLTQRCPKVGVELQDETLVKQPFHIPFAVGLLDRDGRDIVLRLAGEAGGANGVNDMPAATTRVLDFTQERQSFTFVDVPHNPMPSLLRGFSAPVIVEHEYTIDELAFLMAHDSDPFNRWEAGQRLATRQLLALVESIQLGQLPSVDSYVLEAFRQVLRDESLDPAFRAQALTLPAESYLGEQMTEIDPAAIHAARQYLRQRLAASLHTEWLAAYHNHRVPGPYRPDAASAGERALKNLALSYLMELSDAGVAQTARTQYDTADNMTDRFAALAALVQRGGAAREGEAAHGPNHAAEALEDYYQRFEHEPLVIDKWFALQAMQRGDGSHCVIDAVRALMRHPAFTLKNPNRARSLIFSFCSGNPAQFHATDGSGYRFWAEQVLALDALNPQVAARLARVLDRWRKYTPALREHMREALGEVSRHTSLSKDVREIVEKALA